MKLQEHKGKTEEDEAEGKKQPSVWNCRANPAQQNCRG
jgi:hypothetical protein